jgi:hypothetical protein
MCVWAYVRIEQEHPSYATSLSNFANVLGSMGDAASLKRAMKLYEQAMGIYERVLGTVRARGNEIRRGGSACLCLGAIRRT